MKLKVCTFNLRNDSAGDGINCFDGRKELIGREFLKYDADIIGFQEVRTHMRDWLEGNLTGYTVVGTGRDADLRGEHVSIAYKTEKFRLVSLDTFWLSDTPRVPGSRFGTDQSKCPRICTAAVLMSIEEGKCFRVYNTHLDHVGVMAQAQGITLVLSRIAQDDALYPDVPVFLTGDFNITPDNPIVAGIGAFTSCGKKLVDVTTDVGGTYHAYKPSEICIKIDYIFTNAACDASASRTLTDEENGVFFSDHYPVMAEAEM